MVKISSCRCTLVCQCYRRNFNYLDGIVLRFSEKSERPLLLSLIMYHLKWRSGKPSKILDSETSCFSDQNSTAFARLLFLSQMMKFVKFQLFPSKFCNLFYWSHPCIDPFFIANPKIQFLLARVHMKKGSMQSPSIFKTVQCCAQSSVYQNKALVYYS